MKPLVILPRPKTKGFYQSWDGGAFRGLVKSWSRSGLVDIKRSESPFCWMNKIGDVLLYDRPTLEFLNPNLRYEIGLFGNPEPPVNGKRNSYWTFWSMIPQRIDMFRKSLLSFNERDIRLLWIGSYENKTQRGYRPVNWWEKSTDFCSYGPVREYTHSQYLMINRRARFGLCLRGYGPKCCRDIEYMALGVVPIMTHGCSVSYYNRLTPGLHYLYASCPDEAIDLTSSISEKSWKEMSNACVEWYNQNCSSFGSFNTTMKIIDELRLR